MQWAIKKYVLIGFAFDQLNYLAVGVWYVLTSFPGTNTTIRKREECMTLKQLRQLPKEAPFAVEEIQYSYFCIVNRKENSKAHQYIVHINNHRVLY